MCLVLGGLCTLMPVLSPEHQHRKCGVPQVCSALLVGSWASVASAGATPSLRLQGVADIRALRGGIAMESPAPVVPVFKSTRRSETWEERAFKATAAGGGLRLHRG
jgi:hypothetical protein